MKLTPVKSSNIKAVGHKDCTLYVEFKNGRTFSYEDVSNEKYERLMTSDSIGSFFARNIRANHKASGVELNEKS